MRGQERGVGKFKMLDALEAELGAGAWAKLRDAEDLNSRADEVNRVIEIGLEHAKWVQQPSAARRDAFRDRERVEVLEWEPDKRKQVYNGHRRCSKAANEAEADDEA